MISLFHVNTLVVPLQIRLPDKLLVAIFQWTWEGVLATRIMSFHMSLEVVAPPK
jgi:hypothetical protein